MSQPVAYTPIHSFVADSASVPLFPGQALDVEFQDIRVTLTQILANLALIQRDDGALVNGIATFDSLSAALQANGMGTVNAASFAPLASPALTGVPTAPTAGVTTNTTQIATTAFVRSLLALAAPIMDGAAAVGIATKFAREDHVHPTDTSRAPLAAPALTGIPTAPTAAPGTNNTQIATTAYADAIKASPAFTGVPTAPTATPGTNTTQLATTAYADAIAVLKANLASPTFTGTPSAPTAAVDTNTTQLATTAMVLAQAASATPLAIGTAAVGTSTRVARADHVHAMTSLTAALGADVTLNNTGTFFDGPSIAQGTSGTWFVSGTVTCVDTAGGGAFAVKLWDGTTVIASTLMNTSAANFRGVATLSGVITSPAGNLKLSVEDTASTSGFIRFNTSGFSKDSMITAFRIG